MPDHTNHLRCGRPMRAVSALLAVCLSAPLAGQMQTVTGGKKKAPEAAAAALDPNPLVAESLGLKMNLPAGAATVAEKVNAQLVISVSESAQPPSWSMRIQTVNATRPEATAATLIDDLLLDFKNRRIDVMPLSNSPVAIGKTVGQLAYVKQDRLEGEIIGGWLVLPTGQQSFLVFAVQSLPGTFEAIRPVLDASFATIELQSADEVASQRMARLEAGRTLLAGLSKEKLKSLVGARQWLRIYQPNKDGTTTEHGCSMLEVLEGKRREVNPQRAARGKGDDADGLLVRVQGRIVVEAKRNVYFDSMALYWMAWDQSEEEWSVVGTHRQGDAAQSEAEGGVREPRTSDTPRPRLIVIRSDKNSGARAPVEWYVPDVYASQPLGWLMPRLMPAGVTQPIEYAFYAYNFSSADPQLSQRLDTWEPANDGTNHYKLTTQLSSDAPAVVSIYKPDGSLVRRTHPDGWITEPISIEELHNLWKSKGLRVSSGGR